MQVAILSGHLGEVVEASTTQFTAQCVTLHEPPPLGCFVKIVSGLQDSQPESDPFATRSRLDDAVFGLVYQASTRSLDPNRRAAAYGLEEDDLRREQPQVYELLASEFTCLIVGHSRDGRCLSYLPPRPPGIHARVWQCENAEVYELSEGMGFIRTVLAAECSAPDEVIAASLRHCYQRRGDDDDFLIGACKELALLLRQDYERLISIIRKLPALPDTL